MAVLLKDALKPNLVQTLEGQPALVHAGPFANIAHGNSSLVGDLVGAEARRLRRHRRRLRAATSASRSSSTSCAARAGSRPHAVVLVATTQALKRHGGDPDGGLPALERGAQNLAAHLRIVEELGFHAVVAVNKFPGDDSSSSSRPSQPSRSTSAPSALRSTTRMRMAAKGLPRSPSSSSKRRTAEAQARFVYDLADPVEKKLDALARKIYGGSGASSRPLHARRSSGCPPSSTRFRSASRRPTSPSRTTRSSSGRRPTSSSLSGSYGPTREPAGSSRSAARRRRCRGFQRTPRPRGWISTPAAGSSA